MGFEIPLSDEAVRVFRRVNNKIADLLSEVQQKGKEIEALKKENEKLKEKTQTGKGRKVDQVRRWRKNNPAKLREQKKRWRERQRGKIRGQKKKNKLSEKRQQEEERKEKGERKKMRELLESFVYLRFLSFFLSFLLDSGFSALNFTYNDWSKKTLCLKAQPH